MSAENRPPKKSRKGPITTTTVDALGPGETITDDKLPGFKVRRQRGDARVYSVRPMHRGQRVFVTIGTHGRNGWTAATARAEAQRIIALHTDPEGRSPAGRKARERNRITVAALAAVWQAEHVAVRAKPSTQALYATVLAAHIVPKLGTVPVADLSRATVTRALLNPLAETPGAAAQCVRVLKSMVSWGIAHEHVQVQVDPLAWLVAQKSEPRQRRLSLEDVAALGSGLRAVSQAQRGYSPYALAAIGLMLLTGMRRGEVLGLEWSRVDLKAGRVWLADHKGRRRGKGGARAVALSAPAVRLLDALPRQTSPYVFPGAVPRKPLVEIRKTWRAVLKAAGLDGVDASGERLVPHSLRHSFASLGADAGVPMAGVSRALGHSTMAMTERYAHPGEAAARAAVDAVGALLADALPPLGGEPGDGNAP